LDEFQVATMVVPLGSFQKGAVLPDGSTAPVTDLYYDCRHLQPNGDCRIYDNRPRMCRTYPNGKPCARQGCTYTED
jgi:Fe-S-cluster containining protein